MIGCSHLRPGIGRYHDRLSPHPAKGLRRGDARSNFGGQCDSGLEKRTPRKMPPCLSSAINPVRCIYPDLSRLQLRVKGGCCRSGGGTAGVPPASEITPPFWDDPIGPPGHVRNSPDPDWSGALVMSVAWGRAEVSGKLSTRRDYDDAAVLGGQQQGFRDRAPVRLVLLHFG